MTKVAVVVVNWNRPKDTIETLKSLAKSHLTKLEVEVVVVDNGSTDNSVELLRKYIGGSKHTQLLTSSVNTGFTGGNNMGIHAGLEMGCNYVLLLNNDVRVDPTMLINLLSPFDDDTVMIVSPKIYFEKGFEFHKSNYLPSQLGTVFWFAGGQIDWNNVFGVNRGVDEVDTGQYDNIETEDFATGAAMMIRSELFSTIGFLDERYFMYFEDVDFSYRTKHAGYKLMYNPRAVVWHKVAQSSGIGSDLNDYYISRNRLLFGLARAPLKVKLSLVKEAVKFVLSGRPWQRRGVIDYITHTMGKGSWN